MFRTALLDRLWSVRTAGMNIQLWARVLVARFVNDRRKSIEN